MRFDSRNTATQIDMTSMSTTRMMDVDVDIHMESDLNDYTRVQQVPLDTDPLMWWNQHVQEFPRLARMTSQYLTVSATSTSPERLFSSVGLVKSDLRGRLLDTTLIDVMWAKQSPRTHCVTDTHLSLSLTPTSI